MTAARKADKLNSGDPASIPAFDRAMRGLIAVPKAELGAELKKSAKPAKIPKRKNSKPQP